MRFAALTTLLAAAPLLAQQGDKGGHGNMSPVVPEELIPPAPVLSVGQALQSFEIARGFVVEPVAAEPLVDKPVCLDYDAAGRLWVCEMRGYMPDIDGKLESEPQGRIVVLEDSDGDGRADQRHVFLDQLLLPRAISVFGDGILFLDEHRLCWVERDGLAPAGEPEVIDPEFAKGGNVEHKPNGLLRNLDNWIYLAKSDKRIRRVGDEWRIENTSFRGQWGIARDDFGRLYHNNNSTFLFADRVAPNLLQGNPGVRMRLREAVKVGSNRVWPIRVTPGINRAYMDRRNGYKEQTLDPETHKLINTTAASGMTIYRGTNFPDAWKGTAFVTEPCVQLVKAIRIGEKDGVPTGSHPLGEKEFLASTDERFRPVNAYTAPDGTLHVVDMYHGIIQHRTYMTSYLREQTLSRGLDGPGVGHGRIYRVRSRSGKLEPPVDIAALEGLELVRMLMHPNSWHREMAQRVMVEQADPELVPLLEKLTLRGPVVARIHAIWTLEGMGSLEAKHLVAALGDSDPELQASALWASTRLDAAGRGKLAPVLARLRPADDGVLPYLARALGSTGDEAAFDALADLLENHRRAPFVREAAVSGLDHHEKEFIASHLAESRDKQLVEWLEQGASSASRRERGPGLEGADLASFERGKALYLGEAACFGCHGADGAGLPNLGPPLENSEWVTGKPEILTRILLHGMSGPVTVDGETYTPPTDMPGLSFNPAMSDQRLADIATYIRHEWGHKAGVVKPELVTRERAATKERAGRPWTAEELK